LTKRPKYENLGPKKGQIRAIKFLPGQLGSKGISAHLDRFPLICIMNEQSNKHKSRCDYIKESPKNDSLSTTLMTIPAGYPPVVFYDVTLQDLQTT